MPLVKYVYFVLALIIALLISLNSVQYLDGSSESFFLNDKKEVYHFYKYFLYAHIIGSPMAFFSGLFQFAFNKSRMHKWAGYIYILAVVVLAGPGGLIMSFYAIGGLPSIINFSLLSLLWISFTLIALILAKKGDYQSHQVYMTRSFILANSAILIRLLSFLNNQTNLMDTEMAYIVIGWLSWVPTLVLYEILRTKSVSTQST